MILLVTSTEFQRLVSDIAVTSGAEPDNVANEFAQNAFASDFMVMDNEDNWESNAPEILHVGHEYMDTIKDILGFLEDRYCFFNHCNALLMFGQAMIPYRMSGMTHAPKEIIMKGHASAGQCKCQH